MNRVEEARARYIRNVVDDAERLFRDALARACESPIEEIFVAELFAAGFVYDPYANQEAIALMRTVLPTGQYPKAILTGTLTGDYAELAWYGQFPLEVECARCRLDSAFSATWPMRSGEKNATKWFAVECDGHDFHERTKAQAARDRSRDRALTRIGWTPLRFTGSELHANPRGCIDELFRIIGAGKPEGAY